MYVKGDGHAETNRGAGMATTLGQPLGREHRPNRHIWGSRTAVCRDLNTHGHG